MTQGGDVGWEAGHTSKDDSCPRKYMIMSNLTTSRTENDNSSVGSIEYSLALASVLYQDGNKTRDKHTLRSTTVSAQATLMPSALGNPHNGFEVISPS